MTTTATKDESAVSLDLKDSIANRQLGALLGQREDRLRLDLRDPRPLSIGIVGPRGSGKTLGAAGIGRVLKDKGFKVYADFPVEFADEWSETIAADLPVKMDPPGAVLLVDNLMDKALPDNPLFLDSATKPYYGCLLSRRVMGLTVVWTSQHMAEVPEWVQEETDHILHARLQRREGAEMDVVLSAFTVRVRNAHELAGQYGIADKPV